MDQKIETYQNIIVALLEQHAQHVPVNVQEAENEIIADKDRNHFQLTSLGWENDNKFFLNIVFYFDIKPDGKIWIQANNTELNVAEELVKRGVEKSDIVIGFQPPRYRPYTGYAVA